MKLQEKILYCRKRADLSQEALADQIGVSRQAISKWETGDAALLRMSVRSMFGFPGGRAQFKKF